MSTVRQMAALMIAMVAGVGCASVQTPTAIVRSANVTQVTPAGFTLDLAVDVDNPNAIELPMAASDYALELGGTRVVSGTVTPAGVIPAKGSTRVNVPLAVTFDNLLLAERAIVASGGDVPFSVSGKLGIDAGKASGIPLLGKLGGPTGIPLKYEGTLPLRQMLRDPLVVMRSPAARKLAERVVGGIMTR